MRLIYVFILCLFCVTAMAQQGLDKFILKLSNISTSSTLSEVQSAPFKGYLEKIIVTFKTNQISANVDLFSTNVFSGVTQLVYTVDAISNTVILYPRIQGHDSNGSTMTTNATIRHTFIDDKIYLRANANLNATNQDVTAIIYYLRP